MSCRAYLPDESHAADLVCEAPPTTVFLNALPAGFESCDRRADTMRRIDEEFAADMCYVYCAKRSCGAAEAFMQEHADALHQKCAMVTYLHNGALAMPPEDLVDGAACHASILAGEERSGERMCVTCGEGEGVPISVTVDDEEVEARLVATSGSPPDWYTRAGILAPLPTQFSCDDRYRAAPVGPITHRPSAACAQTVRIDISDTDVPADSLLAYWAAKPSESIAPAAVAYDDFSNSGITRCDGTSCTLHVEPPGAYAADGEVFPPHIHFTEWLGDRWNTAARTINLSEH